MIKNRLLIIADHYKPGVKAGGPIQSLYNLTTLLKNIFDIYLVNKNHDYKERDVPYIEVESDTWIYSSEYGINVFYMSPLNTKMSTFRKIFRIVTPNYIYLNSFFSPSATILPLISLLLNKDSVKIVLAPRGELNIEALNIKAYRKNLYLKLFNLAFKSYIYKYHATSLQEKKRIVLKLGIEESKISVISNPSYQGEVPLVSKSKNDMNAQFLMLSRISRIKNIDYLLELLNYCDNEVSVHIYGVIEDQEYWEICKEKIEKLPAYINVEYKGMIQPSEVFATISNYRFFISPTKGENFGHSIFEAMLSGKPVIISDKTPWIGLEKKNIGWDIPLEDREKWVNILEYCACMKEQEYIQMTLDTWAFAGNFRKRTDLTNLYTKLFS